MCLRQATWVSMRVRKALTSSVHAVCVLLFTWTNAAVAAQLDGVIVGITDGDTVTLLDKKRTQYKVRLTGIDAPESGQPYSQRSRQNLSVLVFNKKVTVEWSKRDRYGRILGKVLFSEVDINLKQVEAGLAWHFKKYAKEQPGDDQMRYAEAENRARTLREGLWRDDKPIPPWEWRKDKKYIAGH